MITPYLMPVIALVLGVVSLFHDKKKQKYVAYVVLVPLLCLSCGMTIYANYQSGVSTQERWERLFALLEEENEKESEEIQKLQENITAQKEVYRNMVDTLRELSIQPNLSNPVRTNYMRLSENFDTQLKELESIEEKALDITDKRKIRWDEIKTYIANPQMEIKP